MSIELTKFTPPQAIEQLHFTVNPTMIDRFIELDTEIWTKKLSEKEGFVKKEIWVNDDIKGEVYTLTFWEDMSFWAAIDAGELAATAKIFDEAMGSENYKFNTPLHVRSQKYKTHEFVK